MKLTSLNPKLGWRPSKEFSLLGVDNKSWSLSDVKGENGSVVMFICNHCPYVKAVADRLNHTAIILGSMGVGCIAINSNDALSYPDDDFENMKQFSENYKFKFPYVIDDTQVVARHWEAVCTPEFFGLCKENKLLYRGRLDSAERGLVDSSTSQDLIIAMEYMIATGKALPKQYPSVGCSIKWK